MELRSYQREACDATWHWFNTNAGNCVICLPTGAGKSLVIAELVRQTIEWGFRAIVLAHRRELIQQDAEKIHRLIPDVSLGIYSAGLNFRHTAHDIVVAGIQSVFRRAAEFGARHLVLVDEVHLVNPRDDTMYKSFLSDLRSINPNIRFGGLTATPYRTGEGSLCGADRIFQGIAYSADVRALIEAGYLCPIVNTVAEGEADTSKLHVRAGEFIAREVESLFGDEYLIRRSVAEVVQKTSGRHSVLIFCAGVDHAERVAQEIEKVSGVPCGVVTGETPPLERAGILDRFKTQRLKYLCNVDVLTTGFDAPCIDAIAILRATDSAGLFAQIVGRGLRTHESKSDCALLDFGQNLKRHGPIDDIKFGTRRAGTGGSDDSSWKLCPNCEEKLAPAVRLCECGFRFPPPQIKHDETADTESAVLSEPPVPIVWEVLDVNVFRHKKRGDGPNTFRVDYTCVPFERPVPDASEPCPDCGEEATTVTLCETSPHYARLDCACGRFVKWVAKPRQNLAKQTIQEWVCVEHVDPFPLKKAKQWWALHTLADFGGDIDEAISLFNRGAFRMPARITTVKEGRWNKITAREFEEERPTQWAEEEFVAPWDEAPIGEAF